MKYIFLGVIVFICGYIGYGLSKYYISRLKFFNDLLNFAEKFETEINFSKTKLLNVVDGFKSTSKEFVTILNSYKLFLNEGQILNENLMFDKIKILKEEEKHCVFMFFNELGKFDVYNQTKQIENYKVKFNDIIHSCVEDKKKYGTLYVKLGIILGLLFALLLF